MTTRPLSLLAAASLLVVAAPAFAGNRGQDPAPYPAETSTGEWRGQWDGGWDSDDRYHGVWNGTYVGADGEEYDAEYRGVFHGDTRFVSEDGRHQLYRDGPDGRGGWREQSGRGYDRGHRRDGAQRGYSDSQRAAWIDDCRANYHSQNNRDGDGRLIGGVIGAVAGGVIGNRVGGRGNRLPGTLIGAGVGGVAGAVAGDAIDRDGRRRDYDRSYDECEAYLSRYEAGAAGGGYQYGYGYPAYAPMMMVPVPITTHYRYSAPREYLVEDVEIIEERIVEERPARRPAARPAPARRVAPDKRQRIR